MKTLVGLELAPEHRRGHGALYAGLNRGRLDVGRMCRVLVSVPLPSTPRFLGREGEFPQDHAALAEALSHQLSAGAWPEFGERPVLMPLRVSGDERVDSLRRQALEEYTRQVLEASGTRRPQDGDERLLRAELLVALGVGVAVVRSAVGLQPLGDATSDDLIGPLRDVVDVLLAPPH